MNRNQDWLSRRMARLVVAGAVCIGAVASGCTTNEANPPSPDSGTGAGIAAVPDGCHPYFLVGGPEGGRGACVLPYPSDFYRVPDASSRTGARIELRGAAKPTTATGRNADLHEIHALDGFSRAPTLVATLPGDLTSTNLPDVLSPEASSTSPASASILIEADTGVFVPHYTDVSRAADADGVKTLAVRPHVLLKPSTRYVVALRDVRVASGERAPSPPHFVELLEGRTPPGSDPAIQAYAGRFATDIVRPLERVGVDRKELQLAWDFTTGTTEAAREDMLRVRELTLAWLGTHVPQVTVTEDQPAENRIWRFVRGTVTAPRFVESSEPGAKLMRDAEGRVVLDGTVEVPFLAQIPQSVRDQYPPARAIAYGHGFFGSREELTGGSTRTIGSHLRAVSFSIDYWGFSKDDLGVLATALTGNTQDMVGFTDRAHQGIANWMVMTAAIKGPIAELPNFKRPAEGVGVVVNPENPSENNAGRLLYDPAAVHLLGISGGHLMGGILSALDPNLSRIVLQAGGAGFTHMMPRAGPFGPLQTLLALSLKNKVLEQAFIGMLARPFDRVDPATYAEAIVREPLEGSPPRHVLMQIGLGDHAVPNVTSFFHARAAGLSQISPGEFPVFGLPPVGGTTDASALQLFDFGLDVSFYREPTQPTPNPVHDTMRVRPAALAQMEAFLKADGQTIDPCGGPCREGQ